MQQVIFLKNVSWSNFYTAKLFLWLLEFLSLEWKKCFEKHKSPWLYLLKPFLRQKCCFALFQLFFISLLFLSTAFWLGRLCFCWTSSPFGTKADMKLSFQCFQVRPWISAWNSHVLLWGIQYEYCDSHYSTCHIKMRCLLQWSINTSWLCTALKKTN